MTKGESAFRDKNFECIHVTWKGYTKTPFFKKKGSKSPKIDESVQPTKMNKKRGCSKAVALLSGSGRI